MSSLLSELFNIVNYFPDLKNPKTNHKSAGFTPQEREGMTQLLEQGFVDTFRHLNPDKEGAFTFWNYLGNCRSRNTGWYVLSNLYCSFNSSKTKTQ